MVPQGTYPQPRYLPLSRSGFGGPQDTCPPSQGTYPCPGQNGLEGVPQGTYPPPPQPRYLSPWSRYLPPCPVQDGVGVGEGVPQGTYPRPRYLLIAQVRMGEGVPQGTYPPAKVPTSPRRGIGQNMEYCGRYTSCDHTGLSYYALFSGWRNQLLLQ